MQRILIAGCGYVGKRLATRLLERAVAPQERDGFRATMLMLTGAVEDFNFSARVRAKGLVSTQFLLTPVPNVTYSACLVSKIEQMFTTGKAPYSIDRTLLTSGILEGCLTSKLQGEKRLETPHLKVNYRPPAEK